MARKRNRKPSHPGLVFKLDVMEPLNLNVTQVAKAIGVSRKHLSLFVNEHIPCSKDLAQRIAIATKTSMRSWLDMQIALDVWEAENQPNKAMSKVRTLAA
ncbi:MAG: HigA family addiction module antitoxin [Pseudomonadales bacterium]